MIAYLRLVRLPNLLLIVLAQLLVRHCLVLPAFSAEYFITGHFPVGLSSFQFSMLVVSTVLLAAGGYIINDLYDTDIDAINKPNRVIVGNAVSVRQARILYAAFTIAGCLLGIVLAYWIGRYSLAGIHLFVAVSLWMYASQLKRQLLIGNILVSVLSALSLLIVGLFEPEFYRNILFLGVYAAYAFALTLIREIIKDMEDLEGDERNQVRSLPVLFGIKRTRLVVLVLIVITAWMLSETLRAAFYNSIVVSYRNMLMVCELPFAVLLYLVATANTKKDFHLASTVCKIIMFIGVASLLPLYLYFIR